MTLDSKRSRFARTFSLATTVAAVLAMTAFLSACGDLVSPSASDDGNGGDSAKEADTKVDIPSVDIRCTSLKCKSWSGGSPHVYVYYTTGGCSGDGANSEASGDQTIACAPGSGCQAVVSAHSGSFGADDVDKLEEGNYSVCATITFNSNELPGQSPGSEASSQISLDSWSSSPTLDNWTDR
jgi:hypothetical protein